MNTTATWYRNGAEQSGGYAGCVGYDGGPIVGRFRFTTPATGAARLSFASSSYAPGSSQTGSASMNSFRFAVTADSTANISKVGTDGFAAGGNYWDSPGSMVNDGAASVQLLPNTTYYLWIYPAESRYGVWRITSVSVSLSGSYGNPAAPTSTDGYFGHAIGITLSGGSADATYTVTASCAGHTETLQTRAPDTYLSWTPALAVYGPLVPNAATAIATITVETYYGNTSIGTNSTSVTLYFRTVDAGPAVSAGWYSHTPYNAGAGSGIQKYIQGVSRAQITFDTSKTAAQYGASIVSYSVVCGQETATEAPYLTPILSAQATIAVAVTDSRGFSAVENFSITPLSYAAPALSRVSIYRCDQNGNADENGRYCCAAATAVISDLEGSNSASMRFYLKIASGASWGNGVAMQSGTALICGGLDPDLVYDALIELPDAVGNTGRVFRRIAGRTWAMRFRPNGKGVGFGMSPQADRRLELPAGWSIVIGSTTLSESELQALKGLLSG